MVAFVPVFLVLHRSQTAARQSYSYKYVYRGR